MMQLPAAAQNVARPLNGAAQVLRSADAATVAVTLAVTAFAFLLRIVFLDRSYEVFFDEAIYLGISKQVASSFALTYDGTVPFFLHPPLFFGIEAGFLKMLHSPGDFISQVFAVRYLNAAFGALTAGVIFLLGRRLAGTWAGLLAAAMFALEPFVIRIDSRNLLEPSATLWVVLGMTLVASMLGRRFSWRRASAAGLVFGAALLTNEPTAILTLMPLAACAVLGWVIPRRAAVVAAVVACLVYSAYPLAVYWSGSWGEFQAQKFRGVLRFSGRLQVSGFNSAGGPSFQSAIGSHLHDFATTYAIIAVGAAAVLFLLFKRDASSRLVALWAGSAYVLQAFSIKFGTNEEQYFYYLVVMAIVAVSVAGAALMRAVVGQSGRRRLQVALGFALAVFFGLSAQIWLQQHTTPDNGYRVVMDSLSRDAAPGTMVAGTSSTDQALLDWLGYQPTSASSPAALQKSGVRYVLISTELTAQGYGTGTPQLLHWLESHGHVVARFKGPTDGELILFQIPRPA